MKYNIGVDESTIKENDKKSCIQLSVSIFVIAFFELLCFILTYFGVFDILLDYELSILTISGLINLVVGFLPLILIKKANKIKYIFLVYLVFVVGILDSTFSFYSLPFMLIPVIVSVRFYNKRLTLSLIILSIVTLFLSGVVGYFSEYEAVLSSQVSGSLFNLDWSYFAVYLKEIYFFKIINLGLPFGVCYVIAKHGKKLIDIELKTSGEKIVLEKDIKTASLIQNQVLPKDFDLASDKGINLYATMKAAKETAGDFYDFFTVKDNLYFLVGDVSDKGLYAAMFMMNIKSIIHSLALNCDSLETIITQANKLISKDNKALMFVTLWIGCINTKTKKGYYLNAGHNFAIIKGKDGSISELKNTPQPFIGVFPNYKYKKRELNLRQDDLIYIYTDGVTDLLNSKNESYGLERLKKLIRTNKTDPKELCENINNDLKSFSTGVNLFDDITMLSLSLSGFDYKAKFKCEHQNIEKIINKINKDLKTNNVDKDQINLIDSALDDLLDNVVSYAYEDKTNSFEFMYSIKDKKINMVLVDEGVQFNPLEISDPDLSKERAIGGLGIYLYKNIMTEVRYTRNNNKNILFLSKNL